MSDIAYKNVIFALYLSVSGNKDLPFISDFEFIENLHYLASDRAYIQTLEIMNRIFESKMNDGNIRTELMYQIFEVTDNVDKEELIRGVGIFLNVIQQLSILYCEAVGIYLTIPGLKRILKDDRKVSNTLNVKHKESFHRTIHSSYHLLFNHLYFIGCVPTDLEYCTLDFKETTFRIGEKIDSIIGSLQIIHYFCPILDKLFKTKSWSAFQGTTGQFIDSLVRVRSILPH